MKQQIADFDRYWREASARLAREQELVQTLVRQGRDSRRATERLAFLQELLDTIQRQYQALIAELQEKTSPGEPVPGAAPATPDSTTLNVLVAITRVSRGSVPQSLPR
jgi:hypothetical protein